MNRQHLTLDAYLLTRFESTRREHLKAGRSFPLTFEEYKNDLDESIYASGFRKAFYIYKRTGKLIVHVYAFRNRDLMRQGVCSTKTMHWTTRGQARRSMGMKKGDRHSPESKVKMSRSQRKRFDQPEERQKASAAHTGKHHSAETREKMAAAKLGRKQSEAQCANRRATWARKREEKALAALGQTPEVMVKIKQADSRATTPPKLPQKHTKSVALLQQIKAKTHPNMRRPDLELKIPSGAYTGWDIGDLALSDVEIMFERKTFEHECPQLQVVINRVILDDRESKL